MTLYIGVMSGTSFDGVDVVLCRIAKGRCTLLQAYTHPFPKALKDSLLESIATQKSSLQQIGSLHRRLGTLFAEAVRALLRRHTVHPKSITAIGLHGQTLWHDPEGTYPFSLQLGDANTVAAQTGIDVVTDFRNKDIALGGQGAPFAPAFHRFVFRDLPSSSCVANIGGMANITILSEPLLGYDTGPGNVLMDLWISQHRQTDYDNDGAWAQSGNVDNALLQHFLQDPYFLQKAPKSTGREYFNAAWLNNKLKQRHIKPVDVQATLLELSAQSLYREISKFHCKRVLVCGGGAKNSYLMQRLKALLSNVTLHPTEHYGVNSDFMEAMAFAWLAYKRVHCEAVDLKAVTGARSNAILGGIYAGS